MMDHADMSRQSDLDGRGNLSLRAFEEFSVWFLEVCLDQVRFMDDLFDIDGLAERLAYPAQHTGRWSEAGTLLVEILHRGEIAPGQAQVIAGLGEHTARSLVGELVRDALLGSSSEEGPVSLRFPISSADVLFPRVFPET